jgi:hypothetical protein
MQQVVAVAARASQHNTMDTAFIIGNGESRLMYPVKDLKAHGSIYGCNAIYRDHPDLCDHIVAANSDMYKELQEAKQKNKLASSTNIIGPDQLPTWNYILPTDKESDHPEGNNFYRFWIGGDYKTGKIKTRDFSHARGSGCSAVLHAAEAGYRNILLIGFDIIGARQWELNTTTISREQNNVYKNTHNYPDRRGMKAYLKHEWFYQLTQTFCRFRDTNFYYINRQEYLDTNPLLSVYFGHAYGNIKSGIYADLRRWIEGKKESIRWINYRIRK